MKFILENRKGLSLCISISLISYIIQFFEILIFNSKIFDVLIISLLIGIIIKNIPKKIPSFFSREDKAPKFVSKNLLEFAVILLGFNINFSIIKESGLSLITIVIISVILSMCLIYMLCKFILKLDKSVSILVATGNSICGNSAVAVMAPIIGASATDISAVIGISAVLGAAQIILLPLLLVSNIRFFSLKIKKGENKKSKENIATSQTLDYLLWCDPTKYDKSSKVCLNII